MKHWGFCSAECANKAQETLLVKTDFSFDSMDYKKKRGAIKAHPELKSKIESEIRSHLEKKLR